MLEWIKTIGKIIYDRPTRERVMGFRPVVMNLIQSTSDDTYLFVRPTAKPSAWMLAQEGIELNESIERAAVRCLDVELGISEKQLHYRRKIWLSRKAIPERAGERDVDYSIRKMQGKAYYAALIKVDKEQVEIALNPAELSSFKWLTIEEIKRSLDSNSDRKQSLIIDAFQKLLNITIVREA